MPIERVVVHAGIFEGYGQFLAAHGVDFDAILRSHGIAPETFDTSTSKLPFETVWAIFEDAAEHTANPCLCFEWAERVRPGVYGIFGQLLKHSRTLGEAMATIVRYLTLAVQPIDIHYTEDANEASLSWRLPASDIHSRVQYGMFSCAIILTRLRSVAGPDWRPLRVELRTHELPCREPLRRIFGDRIDYNRTVSSLSVATLDLNLKNRLADPELVGLMRDLAERLRSEHSTTQSVIAKTQRALLSRLDQGLVSLEDIAGELKIAPGRLQADLAAAGTNYDAILNAIRMELATGYLRDTDLSMTDISLVLGYSELSAFYPRSSALVRRGPNRAPRNPSESLMYRASGAFLVQATSRCASTGLYTAKTELRTTASPLDGAVTIPLKGRQRPNNLTPTRFP
jgi:AraC-like DNA-binding protein